MPRSSEQRVSNDSDTDESFFYDAGKLNFVHDILVLDISFFLFLITYNHFVFCYHFLTIVYLLF